MINSGYPTMLYMASACEKSESKAVKDTFPQQMAAPYFFSISQNFVTTSCYLFFSRFLCFCVHPADVLQAVLKGPFYFTDHLLRLTHRRQVRGNSSHQRQQMLALKKPQDTCNVFAVLSERVFDEHGSEGEAQGAVRVADTQFPTRRTALPKTNVRKSKRFLSHFISMGCNSYCEILGTFKMLHV